MISVWFWNNYASRPLHIMGGFGVFFFGLGIACGIWAIVLFAMGRDMTDNLMPPLLTVFFVVLGVLMFIFGLMSDKVNIRKEKSMKETVINERNTDEG